MQQGEKVRIGRAGVSIFKVVETDGEGHVVIEPAIDAPGSYPFPMRADDLIPVDE
ncbi:hypothetical protein GS966_28590 [Rhodococcus hoagii]|nr:hypothetical protein [Prescottella equi]NKS10246.1 hypothetical protein [Prescottella equi]NKS35237.1 hypothetical protein [Prescottella equi]NKS62084.1 hypothetical protein [Prescottella equi]NKS68246.1 hypothetical protein [Prescottella equi]